MKRITLTFTMDFEDNVPDQTCINSAMEVLSQDGNFPSDDQVQIQPICPKCESIDTRHHHAAPPQVAIETDWESCDECGHQWGHQ